MQQNGATRASVLEYVRSEWNTVPDYPWSNTPDAAVLRHPGGKWYGLIMQIPRSKLGLPSDEPCDVMNLKCDPMMLGSVLMQTGFFPAYHMNKTHWLTVLLDGSVPEERVTAALKASHALTAHRSGGKRTVPKTWLIPANPKYVSVAELFRTENETVWKQSSAFIPGDTVYIYEGKPIGAVTFVCTVTETGIPYSYHQDGLHMETVMRLRLLGRIPPEAFPTERLKDFGVVSVRGPRGIPEELLAALEAAVITAK